MSATVTELAQKGQEQFLQAVRDSQRLIVEAVGAWAQTVQGLASAAPPVPTVDGTFDLVEKLVASQREFAHDLIAAAAPATKAAKHSDE